MESKYRPIPDQVLVAAGISPELLLPRQPVLFVPAEGGKPNIKNYDIGARVEISDRTIAIGNETWELFEKKIMRDPAWLLKNGMIIIDQRYHPDSKPVATEVYPNQDTTPAVPDSWQLENGVILNDWHTESSIPTSPPSVKAPKLLLFERKVLSEGLENEKITDSQAWTMDAFLWIENKLPDYLRNATTRFRSVRGMIAFYAQWGREELPHGPAFELILKKTHPQAFKNKPAPNFAVDYYTNQETEWEPPFETEVEMLGYALIQEILTRNIYTLLADNMREHAPIAASIVDLLAADEAFHAGAFKQFIEIYYKYDPEATLRDILKVAVNFLMPAQGVRPNPRADVVNAGRLGFSKEFVVNAIEEALGMLSFIPKDLAHTAADYSLYGQQAA